jgi:hypothetical protein
VHAETLSTFRTTRNDRVKREYRSRRRYVKRESRQANQLLSSRNRRRKCSVYPCNTRVVANVDDVAVTEDGARSSQYEHARRSLGDARGAASNRTLPMHYVGGGVAIDLWVRTGTAQLRSPDRLRMCCLSCQLAGTHSSGQAIQARRLYAHAEREGRASVVSDAKRRTTSEAAAGRDAATVGHQYE